ncbi:MAG: hypothetical protein ACI8ZW_000074 [Yoonia sp.]
MKLRRRPAADGVVPKIEAKPTAAFRFIASGLARTAQVSLREANTSLQIPFEMFSSVAMTTRSSDSRLFIVDSAGKTFTDIEQFEGTYYKATSWKPLGLKGFRQKHRY